MSQKNTTSSGGTIGTGNITMSIGSERKVVDISLVDEKSFGRTKGEKEEVMRGDDEENSWHQENEEGNDGRGNHSGDDDSLVPNRKLSPAAGVRRKKKKGDEGISRKGGVTEESAAGGKNSIFSETHETRGLEEIREEERNRRIAGVNHHDDDSQKDSDGDYFPGLHKDCNDDDDVSEGREGIEGTKSREKEKERVHVRSSPFVPYSTGSTDIDPKKNKEKMGVNQIEKKKMMSKKGEGVRRHETSVTSGEEVYDERGQNEKTYLVSYEDDDDDGDEGKRGGGGEGKRDRIRSNKKENDVTTGGKRSQRQRELMEIIKLNSVNYSMFDSPKIPYELFMRIYGRKNFCQKEIQTTDCNDSSSQTSFIRMFDESTQFPFIYFSTRYNGSTCQTSTTKSHQHEITGSSDMMMNNSHIINHTKDYDLEEYQSENSRKVFSNNNNRRVQVMRHRVTDPFRLNHFLLRAEKVINALLDHQDQQILSSSGGYSKKKSSSASSSLRSKSAKRLMKIPKGSEGFCSQFYKLIPSINYDQNRTSPLLSSASSSSSPHDMMNRRKSSVHSPKGLSSRNPVMCMTCDSSYLICVQHILRGSQEVIPDIIASSNIRYNKTTSDDTTKNNDPDGDDDLFGDDDDDTTITSGGNSKKGGEKKKRQEFESRNYQNKRSGGIFFNNSDGSGCPEESLISLWPIRRTTNPDHLLRSRSLITCVTSDDSHVIYTGSSDGSLSIWDLRDPSHLFSSCVGLSSLLYSSTSGGNVRNVHDSSHSSSTTHPDEIRKESRHSNLPKERKHHLNEDQHQQNMIIMTNGNSNSHIRGPSFSTACITSNNTSSSSESINGTCHESSVIQISLTKSRDDHENQLIRIYSMDETNVIISWILLDLIKTDVSYDVSSNGDGMAPGTRVKLIKDYIMKIPQSILEFLSVNSLPLVTSISCDPSDSCSLMIGFNTGHVLNVSKFSQNDINSQNTQQITTIYNELYDESTSAVSFISFNPVADDYFLVSYEDGTICLFQIDKSDVNVTNHTTGDNHNSHHNSASPLLTFDPVDTQISHVESICWMSKCPSAFVVLASSSTILLFNLSIDHMSPLLKYDQFSR